MNRFSIKTVAAIMVLSLVLLLGACSTRNDNVTDPIAPRNNDGVVDSSNEEVIYGYITAYDTVENNITIDRFELITKQDTERMNVLGLDMEKDIINGYHIYNTAEETESYNLAENVSLGLSDFDYLNNNYYQTRWPDAVGYYDNVENIKNEDVAEYVAEGENSPYGMEERSSHRGIYELSWTGRYAGNEMAKLTERLHPDIHIPFAITVRDNVVTKIEEMDNIYL